MVWLEKDKSVSKLLAWCFATLLVIAQFQASAHFHDQNDANLAHECTICVVASHLDDADAAEADFQVDHMLWASPAPQPDNQATPFFPAHISARAPPVS